MFLVVIFKFGQKCAGIVTKGEPKFNILLRNMLFGNRPITFIVDQSDQMTVPVLSHLQSSRIKVTGRVPLRKLTGEVISIVEKMCNTERGCCK